MFSAAGRIEGELVRRIGIATSAVGAMLRSKKTKVHGSVQCNSSANNDL